MYRAKDESGNTFQFYSCEMSMQALEHQKSELFYQSKVELCSGRVVSAEALIRWHHPELALTESTMMKNVAHFIVKLYRLKTLGVALSIDDFGTGYSSLSYLKRFPLNRLKIDQSFIRDCATNAHDAAITRPVIELGHRLNFKVIAERGKPANSRPFYAPAVATRFRVITSARRCRLVSARLLAVRRLRAADGV